MSEERTFTTTEGAVIRVHAVSQLQLQLVSQGVEKRLRAEGLALDPPTYEVKTADGRTERVPHDAESVQTDEEKAAWAAYMAAKARLQRESHEATTKLLLLRGLDIPPAPPGWDAEQVAFGIELPDDLNERRLVYLQVEILRTPEDILNAIMTIMRASVTGTDPSMLEAVEASFRRALAGIAHQGRSATGGGVELSAAVRGNDGSPGVGATAGTVAGSGQ